MVVTCEKCGKAYDDARRWTICPHPYLDDPPPRAAEKESFVTRRIWQTLLLVAVPPLVAVWVAWLLFGE